ncbi:heat shock factor protein 1 isoform X2 [Corythoichthys intestinalis]|uniref:heat shock factor protein 1 isoform X2 n=1 Tax=Corythoichthys intestinalis TaxID=161448 RepID=UPI0025A5F0C6|nr:heat shock factor protein 1 isoform X2 [Corythoichthys intestinalis]
MAYPRSSLENSPLASGNVPAFLTKLWTLVEDPSTDALICWSPSGSSFHVYDQGRFSKEVLPKFFKHNNMASFIRQLNMYGFRKVVHMEQGGLLKPEKDDTEFQHLYFVRGQERLLENIKRKVTNVSAARQDESQISSRGVGKLLDDVQAMKGKQETMDSKINAMKHENEALWREVVCLRQKHAHQQKMVNKLIHFLVSLVQSNGIVGVKRKLPLMLNDAGSAHSLPKYARPFSVQAAPSLFPTESSGPVISDVTELTSAEEALGEWTEAGKASDGEEERAPAPEALPSGDTPLSPATFIDSILRDNDAGAITGEWVSRSDRSEKYQAKTCPPPPLPAAGPRPAADTAPTCQTLACIDKSELSDHIETIDNSLENLQNILSNQSFTFDTSPLMELFNPTCPPGDFDASALDTLLGDHFPKGAEESHDAGKQLVQYARAQHSDGGGGGADLPSLLETEPFLLPDIGDDLNSDL